MSWVADKYGTWHQVRPATDAALTLCGREVPEDRQRVDLPGDPRCRPCDGTRRADTAARDHIAEARRALERVAAQKRVDLTG